MNALTLRAGPRALARLRSHGLSPADVEVIPGAAGGPKALGLNGLDVVLFGEWLPRSPRPRHLIGESIGAWRFAAACLPDPVAGLQALARLYAGQHYPKGTGIALVTRTVREMLADLFAGHEAALVGN